MSSVRHDVATPAPPRAEEVSDGVFAYIQPDGSWWINNTGFLVGRLGVISVDSCSTVGRTRAYVDAIAAITPQPSRASSDVERMRLTYTASCLCWPQRRSVHVHTSVVNCAERTSTAFYLS